ncbi:MAG: ribosome silencing factor [Bacilli bacterium]|mgnify:CR=1 FL=1|nr:ribosome silencing factor [Bacilli bacterium]MCH4210496.1 ribosome silencing factor [Bacilli bacterium]MCH4228280.1 ribosome silencing factor [Bacilli bacterium]MCH4277714.1 ribosome silencing factor [Bacilli bacterium]MCI2054701.1 ribosome silencing factor [Bacilli bacterium]
MNYPKAVKIAVKELEDRKAEEVEVVDVKENTPFSDYYVIATAPNERALGAFADDLDQAFAKNKIDIRQIEGKPESGWVIVDEGSVVVHIFTKEKRAEISLEKLLAEAKKH